ncbi:DUF4956 domain-containing protein [Weissella cibaria]|uniref:DUF4956 domain-containing protein n=1 Tax=Weissella cibaria TaxID=137591 RepID=UPI00223B771F|nr:DUF4956 domain-containing protein [Weissella cibaria]MCT0955500.1 DUF4956 domain-containing protein [Weissella cibaria]
MLNSIFTTTSSGTSVTLPTFILAMATAMLLGLVTALVYLKTYNSRVSPQKFSFTLVLLPVVIAVIIMLVGNNVARAFSLAGAFSIIRFRSAPGDPAEITYVLMTMAIGLGYLAYAVISAIILLVAMLLMNVLNFGGHETTDQLLKLTVPEDMYDKQMVEDVLKQYAQKVVLKRVKTTELGSLFELQYLLRMKSGVDEKAFIDALRTTNGNLGIAMQYNLIADEY